MRRVHRTIGLFFAPFLAASALTGLLWAYAPYLYYPQPKHAEGAKKAAIDEDAPYLPMAEVVRAVRSEAPEGPITNLTLKAVGPELVYTAYVAAKKGQQEVKVDAFSGKAELVVPTLGHRIHYWVKKLHMMQFFGTKKELTIVSGLPLLILLFTGMFLWKTGPRKQKMSEGVKGGK